MRTTCAWARKGTEAGICVLPVLSNQPNPVKFIHLGKNIDLYV